MKISKWKKKNHDFYNNKFIFDSEDKNANNINKVRKEKILILNFFLFKKLIIFLVITKNWQIMKCFFVKKLIKYNLKMKIKKVYCAI